MDYVDWVEKVWQAVGVWWAKADANERLYGCSILDLAPLLQVSADLFSADAEKARAGRAISCALKDLQQLGILRVAAEVSYATYVVAPRAESQLGAHLKGIWPQFMKVPLTERQDALLTELVEVAIDTRGDVS